MPHAPSADHPRTPPRISVVAPTYRRAPGLPAFVEPLLADPVLHELVIAVDGSNDGSVEWLTERARSDPRLVVLDLPNRGAGPTRRAGIERAPCMSPRSAIWSRMPSVPRLEEFTVPRSGARSW